MYSHSRAAFTLWEILGVLCIIAVVTAILLPLFPHPDDHRRVGACRSNLKQLALGFIQYTQDYDEMYPAGSNGTGNGWAGKIYPYVKSTGVYHCPDDLAEGNHISYAENQKIVGQPLTVFADPAATVEAYEFTTLNCDPSTPESVSATGFSAPQNSTRHDPATFALNFAAMDGHVKWMKPEQVSGGMAAVKPKQSMNGGYLMTFAIK